VADTRKLAAILAADVVGYSRLASTDEDRTLARLRALRSDLIDPTIALHNGRVVKRTGDGILIEFRSVVDAVRCAIEVQSSMVERNAGLPPERRIEFRVGIHLGDVVEESDGDLMGDGVNIAARLEGIATPGAICLSEDAYHQVSSRLDMAITDLGTVQLKNIGRPIHAYSLQVGISAQRRLIATKPIKAKMRLPLVAIAVGLVLVFVIGVAGVKYYLRTNSSASVVSNATVPAKAGRFSIVVLPFNNLSGDPAQEYLADALTDELTTAIARTLKNSFVIARSTALSYKGKPIDAKSIGHELGVRYMLEGSIQPSSTQVRVNAQLIDTDSGAHLWADKFDTDRADLLKAQDQIVSRLGHAISYELRAVEAHRIERSPTKITDADDLALRCWSVAYNAGFIAKQAEAGYGLCDEALRIDPNNPRALMTLSYKNYIPAVIGSSVDPKTDLERSYDLIVRAIAVEPDWGEMHFVKGSILWGQGHFDEAIAECETALALDPTLAAAYGTMAQAYRLKGQFERSLELIDRAFVISPRDRSLVWWYSTKSLAYFALKDYEKAIDWGQRAIVENPNIATPYIVLAPAFALGGREDEARDTIERYHTQPYSGLTIERAKGLKTMNTNSQTNPRAVDLWDRWIEGLREAGLPEQ
jgi:adenylate cyclase